MQTATIRYREAELERACPLPVLEQEPGTMSIQMRSAHGHTKFIGITPQEWKLIEDILLGVKQN